MIHPKRLAYLENPNKCQQCNQPILPYDGQRLTQVLIKKFCSSSCAAVYSNTNRIRTRITYTCKNCGITIGKGRRREICNSCLKTLRADSLGKNYISNRTKKDLFEKRGGYQSARSSIRRDAHRTYRISGKPFKCVVCGYDKHVAVSHLKSVSSFPGSALISEINHIDNLVGLCPNHHWEYDNGLLEISRVSEGDSSEEV